MQPLRPRLVAVAVADEGPVFWLRVRLAIHARIRQSRWTARFRRCSQWIGSAADRRILSVAPATAAPARKAICSSSELKTAQCSIAWRLAASLKRSVGVVFTVSADSTQRRYLGISAQ
jgi:hypothetical protein